MWVRHCEERSDEAIQQLQRLIRALDCFASLAMTEFKTLPRRCASHRGLSRRIGGPQIEAGRNIISVDAELAAVEQRLQSAIDERRRRLAAMQLRRQFDQ